MTEGDGSCPVCAKPVVGRAALSDHLEFSHDIADPAAFLRELDQPSRPRPRWRRRVLLATGALAALGALVVAAVALGGGPEGAPDLTAAGSGPADDPTTTTTTSTTAAAPTTAVSTTTTITTAAPTTTATTQAVASGPFRKPFATASRVESCTPGADVDVYRIVVTLSGARNIVIGDEFFSGRTGDGDREFVHEAPAGTTGYLDHVEVADATGTVHEVEVVPWIQLDGC